MDPLDGTAPNRSRPEGYVVSVGVPECLAMIPGVIGFDDMRVMLGGSIMNSVARTEPRPAAADRRELSLTREPRIELVAPDENVRQVI